MDEAHKKALRANLRAWVSGEMLQAMKAGQLCEPDPVLLKQSEESLDNIVDIIAGDL